MNLPERVSFEFVDLVPDEREDGKIYISIPYSTAVHSCLCGCGMKVVTPIKPNKWTLTFNGVAISLTPSIGNWSFPCQSHYWIRDNRVLKSGAMSDGAIAYGRARDAALTERYHSDADGTATTSASPDVPRKRGFWDRLFGR